MTTKEKTQPTERSCSICKQVKPISEYRYYPGRNQWGYRCKPCGKEYQAQRKIIRKERREVEKVAKAKVEQ